MREELDDQECFCEEEFFLHWLLWLHNVQFALGSCLHGNSEMFDQLVEGFNKKYLHGRTYLLHATQGI